MQDARMFRTLVVGALIMAMAALLAGRAQARPAPHLSDGGGVDQSQVTGRPGGELEFKAPPQGTVASDGSGAGIGRTWALGGAGALVVAAAALALVGGQRQRVALP